MTKLKLIFINFSSILSRHKKQYLNIFIYEHNPHILLLAEHKLSVRHKFQLKNYIIFRKDKVGGRGGGTAILVKNWIDRIDKIIQEKIRLFEENYYEPKLNSITKNGDMYRKVKKCCSTQRTKISKLKNKQNQAIHNNEVAYAIPIWYSITSRQMEKIRIFER